MSITSHWYFCELRQIQERVGRFPKNFRMAAKKYKHYFDKDGQLKRFKDIPYIPLKSLLIHKYCLNVIVG